MRLDDAIAYSHYARRLIGADPSLGDEVRASLDAPFDWTQARSATGAVVASAEAGEAIGPALRALRARVMLHTIARDLTGRAGLPEVCATVSTLAELAIDAAASVARRDLVARHGEPIGNESGASQPFVVVGMGKLGGAELNVSSDVDLVFLYPEEGETDGDRGIANREFFERLGRRTNTILADLTPGGFVFRVDMRLRPYGESGPLALPFSGLENYLVTQGRAWERYAWLKARAITGVPQQDLDAVVAPFVYRKYLDYDVYDGLRDVHRQIRAEAARRSALDDVKLGPGGIREIEFTVQAQQIVRGGREPELRVRNTREALRALQERGYLPDAAARALDRAYVFLRDTEHRLQYRDDEQTQSLPPDPAEFEALARSMRFDRADAFRAELDAHRRDAGRQFDSAFGDGEGRASEPVDNAWSRLWDSPSDEDTGAAALAAAGFEDPPGLLATLARARSGARYLSLPVQSRDRMDHIVPRMLATAAAHPGPAGAQATFMRLLALLDAVARRSAYLALIIEHPPLLPRLATLMGASSWAADYLTRHPILLDELLDARVLTAEPDPLAWRAELARMLAASEGDQEREMDALRHFQHAQAFRLLAQDLAGTLTVERLADHLSALADAILDAALSTCWAHLAGRDAPAPHFAIVGYGKLGGKEMGYASDLDLVFLHEAEPGDPDPDATLARYARLAQRLNTWLTATTAAGQLYDTDLRLRPDGAKGLIATSLASFKRYQREHAWTWEHQALTRARWCAGNAAIGAAFETDRIELLRMPRDRAKLATDVVEMRRRMHAGHPNPTRLFDLKHDTGGMVDIEFTVQFLVLAHAHDHPRLTGNLGNIALLAMAGELGLVPCALAARVADAYREFRRAQHAVRLTGASSARVDPELHAARRTDVATLWSEVFGGPWQGGHPESG